MDPQTRLLIHTQNQKLEFHNILQQALKVLYRNPTFIIFTLSTSLPLFFSMLIYESIFQTTLAELSTILDPPYGFFYRNWPIPTYLSHRFTRDFCCNLLKTGFFYLVPLFISELFSVVATVVLASKIHRGRGERETQMTIKEMIFQVLRKTRWDRPAITAAYVQAISTCILLGLVWLVTNYYIIARHTFYGYFFALFYAVAILLLLKKYLEWSAEMNMGIVISILEDSYGAQAWAKSAYSGKGSEHRGFLLMLVFFVWGLGLRSISLFFGLHKGYGRLIIPVGFLCVGNVMKWVVCTVYFSDCESRAMERKFDEEAGKDTENIGAQEFPADDNLQEEGTTNALKEHS